MQMIGKLGQTAFFSGDLGPYKVGHCTRKVEKGAQDKELEQSDRNFRNDLTKATPMLFKEKIKKLFESETL